MNQGFWSGRRVFLTGHTGFKGAWLVLWLQAMGAKVAGYALQAPSIPSLFDVARVANGMHSEHGDILEFDHLLATLASSEAEIVIHMAAQSLVRQGYVEPVQTYATNVMGTLNLLEAVRRVPGVRAVVIVTSDKCYENREWLWGYRENEPFGGDDPYSSSKACAEIVTQAYRRSFFSGTSEPAAIATVRAGNVFGGGDWAADRLVPDFFRALDAGAPLVIRSPDSVRPWQHVLEPLAGYLMLAERLYVDGQAYAEGWNFGPLDTDARPVRWIADYLCQAFAEASWQQDVSMQPHEAGILKLDSTKARHRLGWSPRWSLETALDACSAWHHAWRSGQDMRVFCTQQIESYLAA